MEQQANDQSPKPRGKGGRPKLPASEKASHIVGPYWLTGEEKRQFDRMYKQSGLKVQANFFRHVLFEKPVKLYYTDENTSKIYNELVDIQRKINKIGNNTNQVVIRVHRAFTAREVMQGIDQLGQHQEQILSILASIERLFQELADQQNGKQQITSAGEMPHP